MLNKIFYLLNHPTPAEIAGAIVTGLASGIMLGVWLHENDIESWDKFKGKLKEGVKRLWISKK